MKDDSLAFWRRVILIDFPYTFTGEQVDLDIIEKLTVERELSGLLNLALDRRARLRKRGQFSYSSTPEQTRERYMLRSDSVAMFIEEKCFIGQDDWGAVEIGKEDFYHAYCTYTRSKQLTPVTKSRFGRMLKDRLGSRIGEGQNKFHHNVWRGISLKTG